jgi:hypothetical protein
VYDSDLQAHKLREAILSSLQIDALQIGTLRIAFLAKPVPHLQFRTAPKHGLWMGDTADNTTQAT